MKKYALLVVLATIGCWFLLRSNITPTAKSEDEKLVHEAMLDYVEGLYQVDSTRIYRSVHPSLKKRGFWFSPEKKAYTEPLEMSFAQLVKLTNTWNKDGKSANEKSPKKIEVFDLLDKTATGKITAEWGVDYCQLAKLDGKWYIMNILWQSPPQLMK